MIKSFGDKELEKCWYNGDCRKINAKLKNRILIKLDWIDAATCIEDLQNPPSNHLHKLTGNYEGYWAISINGPWRLIFQFEESDVYDVQLVQYHSH